MQKTERLKRNIRSVRELLSIVQTMKALSAVSIRRYEETSESVMDYHRTVELGLQAVLHGRGVPPTSARRSGEDAGRALLVFGPAQRLCGPFGEGLARHLVRELEEDPRGRPDRIAVTGEHMGRSLAQFNLEADVFFPAPSSVSEINGTVARLLVEIERWHAEEGFGEVRLLYHRPTPPSSYTPRFIQLLPVDRRWLRGLVRREWPTRKLPVHTLPAEVLLRELLRHNFFVTLYRACADSLTSEHTGRLTAMQSAERRIEDRIGSLESEYRRRRQDEITGEILDIISGFEVLQADEPESGSG